MKIGVISDTHIPKKAKKLPGIVLDAMKDVDHIFHAGDISDISVLSELQKLAPVSAVAGNADPEELQRLLGEKKLITLGGRTFGLCHGHGEKGSTLKRVLECFQAEMPDCIVFGHSHNPYCEVHGKTLLFNPGSPTDKRRNECFSFGILEVKPEIVPKHIYFS
jgi:putative phosphoesterase